MADSNDGGSIDVGAVRGGRGSTMAASPAEPINVFAVMDGLVEKCKVLDYEEHFLRKRPDLKPLSCVYFALPTKPSEQFPYFSSLTSWLLSLVGHDAIEFSEFDDPNSIATSILEHVRRLGFQPDFPASKLRHGSGDMVCLTLDFLATKALQARRFTVLPPVYTAASAPMPVFEGGSDGGGSSGFGGFGDEIAEDDQDERNDPMSAFGQDADSSEDEAEGGGFAVAPVSKAEEAALKLKRQKERDDRSRLMQQEVDSKAWQAEYERVVVLLKMPVTGVSREWKTHLDTSQKHATQLNAVIPATMGQVAKESEILKKALERIRGKEKHINTEYEELGREMRTIAAAHEKIQAEYNTVSTRVAEMTALLKHKTAEVEALKEKMREHNDKMSDTTPLRRMGQSVQALKKEVVKMELRIGIVQQIVGQGQVRRQQEEIKRQRREERERKEKGRGNGANDRLLSKSMV